VSNKPTILTVALLLFLAIALLFGLGARSDVAFAESKVTKGPIECENTTDNKQIYCCQTETDSKGVEIKYCTLCDNTAPPSNCSPRTEARVKLPTSDLPTVEQTPTLSPPKVLSGKNLSSLSTGTIEEQQPPTTLQQQKTTTCPDGSTPNDNGNCPSAKNKTPPPPPPSSDNKQLKGESESNSNDENNNNPTSDHNKKGNDVGQTEEKGEGGRESVTKNGDSDSN
jgi:hypothetical protein